MSDILECDVCVVGTGAGGGMLAYRLARAGLRTISVEQGPSLPDNYFTELNPPGVLKDFGVRAETRFPPSPTDAVYQHELFAGASVRSSSETSAHEFAHYQILALDGLQNLWNGVSLRFAPQDFSAWPISYQDLEAHYSAVEQRIVVCGNADGLSELPDGMFVPPKAPRIADEMVRDAVNALSLPHTHVVANRKAIDTRAGSATRCLSTGVCTSGCPAGAMYKFSGRLLPEIRNLDNYQLLVNSKVIRLRRRAGDRSIAAVECLDTQSRTHFAITARYVVLAAGAIETPRILFNSADDDYPNGLANQNGLLGRYLQDNPGLWLSTSLLKLWGKPAVGDIGYGDHLMIVSRASMDNGEEFPFLGQLIHTRPDVPYYLSAFPPLPKKAKVLLARTMLNSYVTLSMFCSSQAIASNRLELSKSSDKFGIPQVDVHFSAGPAAAGMLKAMRKFGQRVLRKASGWVSIKTYSQQPGAGIHYSGTCRMSQTHEEGVVDTNLRTHEHPNLFVCDGSVLPVLPEKHSGLTIMALADRLADHLKADASSGA